MAWSPYKVWGGALGATDPVLLNVSGGRTSGFLFRKIVDAYGGALPDSVHPVFTNTGREMDETLDFLHEMERRWGVHIVWVERDFVSPEGFRIVGPNSAARHGDRSPFDDVIERKGFLPNAVTRFCTVELKIRAAANFMKSLGYTRWCSVIGYRADELKRLARAEVRDEKGKDPWYTIAPLVDAGITKRDVVSWWKAQDFDLALASVTGKTPLGNCDLCFLKGAANLAGIARDFPERAEWWVGAEKAMAGRTASGATATFRPPDKITHTQIVDAIARQGTLALGDPEETDGDCFCPEPI